MKKRPPSPPATWGIDALEPRLLLDTKLLSGVPRYDWYWGCTPTSVAMIMGYYDRQMFPDIFAGTDGTTFDSIVKSYIAGTAHQVAGQENEPTLGYGYYTGWGDWHNSPSYPAHEANPSSIADFIKTENSVTYLENIGSGIVNFLKWRGYTSGWHVPWPPTPYNQATFQDVVASINEGRPLLLVMDFDGDGQKDHNNPIIGYNTADNTIAIQDPTETFVRWISWAPVTAGVRFGVDSFFQIYAPTPAIPYGLVPASATGIVQAENFDGGANYTAYYDTDSQNWGGAYRTQAVDIETTTDGGAGHNVGWIKAGEWLQYTLDFGGGGLFDMQLRLASASSGGRFHVEVDGADRTGSLTVPGTGGWQNWQTVTVGGLNIGAGQHVVRLVFDTNSTNGYVGNVNWFTFINTAVAPAAPSSLSAAALSPSQIKLNWTDNAGNEDGFIVERSSGGGWSAVTSLGANVTTFTDSGLTAGTAYSYRVCAYNNIGPSANSNVASATTPLSGDVPAAPTGLVATTLGTTQIRLNWTDNATNETGFIIERRMNPTVPWTLVTTLGADAQTFTDGGLSPATQYIYRVRATNGAGESPNSNEVAAVTSSASTPYQGTPGNVGQMIQAENFDNGGEGVAYHDTEAANNGGKYRTTGVDLESTTDSGGGYNVGWVAQREWLAYTVSTPAAGPHSLDVRVASSGAGGTFHVEFDGVNLTGPLTIPNTGGWQKWATITKTGLQLSAGTHIVRLVFDVVGGSGFVGNINWFRLNATPAPPAAPSGLSASAPTAGQVNLSWTDTSDNEASFVIERKIGAAGTWGSLATTGANVTSFSDTSVLGGTQYFYRVRAANGGGNSAWSNEASVTTPAPANTPYRGTPFSIGETIQAEDFDHGGEGVAYHDTESANYGGQYRATGVDVEAATDTGGGYSVGWAKAGEWLAYTIDVTTAGTYTFDARVAQAASGGKFHVEVDGVNVTGSLSIPSTGGWQKWTTISKTGVALSAGVHTLRLVMETNASNGFVGNFNWIKLR